MTSKTLLTTGSVALVSMAIGLGIGWETTTKEREVTTPSRAVETFPEYRRLAGRLRKAQGELEMSARERERLVAANSRLTKEFETLKASLPSERDDATSGPTGSAGVGHSGVEWGEFSTLLAENIPIMRKRFRGESLTTAEEAKIGLLDAELKKVSTKAKALSPSPFFDAGIFDELTTALYQDSLELTDDQVSLLHELNSSVFEELPEDLHSLAPFEKFLLRRDVLSRVWEGLEESLSDAQLEDWEYARRYSEAMLRYGGRFHASVNVSERELLRGWLGTGIAEASSKEAMESLSPIAKDYLSRAKGVLKEYAQTNEELEALPWDERAVLEERLLDLQEQFELRASPNLSESQRQMLQEREPTIIEFRYGDLYFSQAPGSLF